MSLNDYRKVRQNILDTIIRESDYKNPITKQAFTPNPDSMAAGPPQEAGAPPGGGPPPPPPGTPADPMGGGMGAPPMGGDMGMPPMGPEELPPELMSLLGPEEAPPEGGPPEETITIPKDLFEKMLEMIQGDSSDDDDDGDEIKPDDKDEYGEADLVDELHKEIEDIKKQRDEAQGKSQEPPPMEPPLEPADPQMMEPPPAHGSSDVTQSTEDLIAGLTGV